MNDTRGDGVVDGSAGRAVTGIITRSPEVVAGPSAVSTEPLGVGTGSTLVVDGPSGA